MNSQTARKPDDKRPARSNKPNKYVKQTARFDARRDGKPLIFGWGGHLSHKEKIKFQRRITWAIAGLIGLLIVAVIIGTWVNLNVIIPGLPITSVNGHQIPQSDYRKLVALRTELEEEKLNGPNGLNAQAANLKAQVDALQKTIDTDTSTIDSLNKQIQALPAGASSDAKRQQLNAQLASTRKDLNAAQTKHDQLNTQYNNLEQNTIPNEQQLFTQSQVGNDSATWLQDDEIIREWLATQSSAVQAKVNPTATQVNQFIATLKANLPKGMTYSKFLSQDNVTDSDVQTMSALIVRRNNMQTYLASQIKSPAYQVLVRSITASTQADAQKLLTQLQHGSDFGTLAKQKSVDAATASKGGDLGWLVRGQLAQTDQSGVIDNWLFGSSRYVNELSPVLNENGAFHIVQITGIDPSRAIDNATLQSLQTNALSSWLFEQRALPNMKITPVDQNKLTDTANMPPDLPSGAPATAVPGAPSSGLPNTGP
jgi:parvulin-like peptidyl-prolyl isomerase